jgi:hypothetical protein
MRSSRSVVTSVAISLGAGAKRARAIFVPSQVATLAMVLVAIGPAFGSMVITPTYDTAGMMAAGLSSGEITSVETAFAAAAAQFTSNFNDPIHINITVTAVAGATILGESSSNLVSSSYSNMYAHLAADAKTADDATALGPGGSVPATDPVTGSHQWFTTTAEAKAIGLISDNLSNDGTFTFGAGFNYSFDPNSVGPSQFDFEGVAMHEISEIMGRIPGLGTTAINGTPAYLLYDLFRYTGSATRDMTEGNNIYFSINNGTTNLKDYNFPNGNGSDPQDWASGTNDSFNAFSSPGLREALTPVDLQVMDVIGYDRFNAVPEPSTGMLLVAAFLAGGLLLRRATSQR